MFNVITSKLSIICISLFIIILLRYRDTPLLETSCVLNRLARINKVDLLKLIYPPTQIPVEYGTGRGC